MTNTNIYITARDIAENAKLNHEISEELRKYKRRHPDVEQSKTEGSSQNKKALFHWILRAKALRMTCLLGALFFLPNFAQAETCTPTPDCKSLGYTESSCPDGGGVKCPWNTSLMYCCKKCEDKPQTGLVGDLYYCNGQIVGIRVPGQSFAIAMNDASSTMDWNSANSYSTSYRFCEASYGRLPTKDELSAIYNNITYLQEQLQKNGGQQFNSASYWSLSLSDRSTYYTVNPVSSSTNNSFGPSTSFYVRPVLVL